MPACEHRLIIYCLIPGHLAVPRRDFGLYRPREGRARPVLAKNILEKQKFRKFLKKIPKTLPDTVRPYQTCQALSDLPDLVSQFS